MEATITPSGVAQEESEPLQDDSSSPSGAPARTPPQPVKAETEPVKAGVEAENEETLAQKAAEGIREARKAVAQVVVGQERALDEAFIALLCGGHVLLTGAPGTGKTLLVRACAAALGLDMGRVQFTPDLTPADVLGSEVLEQDEHGKRSFRYVRGPVFHQALLADEINRASPRTQAALLEAMEERRVSVGGETYLLPSPFSVWATRNPLEQEGTYPLPEAQLDRFALEIHVGYPDELEERRIMASPIGRDVPLPKARADAAGVLLAQKATRALPMGEDVATGIVALVRALRPGSPQSNALDDASEISWGPSPRAAQALAAAARARAFLDNRSAPSLDDVGALAVSVLAHRMALGYRAAREGRSPAQVVRQLARTTLDL